MKQSIAIIAALMAFFGLSGLIYIIILPGNQLLLASIFGGIAGLGIGGIIAEGLDGR